MLSYLEELHIYTYICIYSRYLPIIGIHEKGLGFIEFAEMVPTELHVLSFAGSLSLRGPCE